MEKFLTFKLKVSLDIKNCNLCSYKNHYYRSKYPIVLLQEHCEIVQFKTGHPVHHQYSIGLISDGPFNTKLVNNIFITNIAKRNEQLIKAYVTGLGHGQRDDNKMSFV